MNQPRGTGSLRQRRPDVWEIRVSLGPDPVAGRSRIRSVTIAGDRRDAEAASARYAQAAALIRSQHHAQPGIPVGQLLHRWLDADHGWRPSTLTGYRSIVRARFPLGRHARARRRRPHPRPGGAGAGDPALR